MCMYASYFHGASDCGFHTFRGGAVSTYDIKPTRFLGEIERDDGSRNYVYCAGFELGAWRVRPFARHLVEWLPDYALTEDELEFHHGNAYEKLRQAAVRVYTSEKYKRRGEAGEISLHAICRDFFETIPISPRVFYKSASNDVVKAFDMVHAKITADAVEIWLGESKLYQDASSAVADAIKSINDHLDAGFLEAQKLLLGPQVPRSTPGYERVRALFQSQTSIDELLNSAVFVVGIFCNSDALAAVSERSQAYVDAAIAEARDLRLKLEQSGLTQRIRLLLIYIPLSTKDDLVTEFDGRLKGLQ